MLRSTVNSAGVSTPQRPGTDPHRRRPDPADSRSRSGRSSPINSTVGWRGTYWTESLVNGKQVADSVSRQYFEFNSRITGPVFSRIFNAGQPKGVKLKHVIEPVFTIRRVSAIDVFDRIVQLESDRLHRGDVWEFGYGLNNRLYAKRTSSREVLSVAINQSYYTDAIAALNTISSIRAAAMRRRRRASTARWPSPLAHSPNDKLQGDFRTEWDPTFHTLKTLAANGCINSGHLQASAGWSRRRYIPGSARIRQPGFRRSLHERLGELAHRGPTRSA